MLHIKAIEWLHAHTAHSCCMAKTSLAPVGNLSVYYYSLQGADSKKRYKRKITLFEGQDPYVMVKNNQPVIFQTLDLLKFISYM